MLIFLPLNKRKQLVSRRKERESRGLVTQQSDPFDSIDEKEEGKRREEEEEVEGDEVAREADGILDRKDVRFSTCVGRRSSRPARRKTAPGTDPHRFETGSHTIQKDTLRKGSIGGDLRTIKANR